MNAFEIGLKQLGSEGLKRLIAFIESGRSLCLDGTYFNGNDP